MGFTISRHVRIRPEIKPSAVEKGNVFTVNRKKDLTGISNVTISADLHGRLALEESPKLKN